MLSCTIRASKQFARLPVSQLAKGARSGPGGLSLAPRRATAQRCFSSSSGTGTGSSSITSGATAAGATKTRTVDKLGLALFGSLSALTFGLGVWQFRRYLWKVDLIDEDLSQLQHPVVDLTDVKMLDDLMGRKVRLRGAFDHSQEVRLGLRSAPSGLFEAAQGMSSNPQGYFLITPMKLDIGATVFVNRGWVPKAASSWERPEGPVTLEAVVTEPEKGGSFAPQNYPAQRHLLWTKREDMLQAVGMTEEQIEFEIFEEIATADAVDAKTKRPTRLPVGRLSSDTQSGKHYVTPETHMTYAITWFSLSLFGIFATYTKFRGRGAARARVMAKKL